MLVTDASNATTKAPTNAKAANTFVNMVLLLQDFVVFETGKHFDLLTRSAQPVAMENLKRGRWASVNDNTGLHELSREIGRSLRDNGWCQHRLVDVIRRFE